MNKLFSILAIFFLVLTSFAHAQTASAQVDIQSITAGSASAGQTATFTMTVGAGSTGAQLTQVDFTSTSLTGPATLSAPTITAITNLAAGSTQTATLGSSTETNPRVMVWGKLVDTSWSPTLAGRDATSSKL